MLEVIIKIGGSIWLLVVIASFVVQRYKPVEFWIVSLLTFFAVTFVIGVPLAGIAYLIGGKEFGQFAGELTMACAMIYAIYKGIAD